MFRTLRLPFLGTALAVALARRMCWLHRRGQGWAAAVRPAPAVAAARPVPAAAAVPRGPGGSSGPGAGGPGGPAASGPVEHVPLRRLTRAQYNNTVRDLLGVTGDAAQSFGLDESEGGFAANSKAPVKELQIEKYQQVAEELAGKAIANMARLAPCAPPARPEAACLDEFLRRLRQARLPPPADRRGEDPLQVAVRGGQGQRPGLRRRASACWCRTMLQSPHFLYRPELGDAGRPTGTGLPLTGWETASRLSYFLQNTMPDDELFAAAEGDRLRTVGAGVGAGPPPAGHAPGARDRHQLPRAVAGRG